MRKIVQFFKNQWQRIVNLFDDGLGGEHRKVSRWPLREPQHPTGGNLRTNDMQISDDPIVNGVHAEQLLNDPLLKKCFDNVRLVYLHKIETTPHSDIETLKMMHLSLTALQDVRRALLGYKFNGQTALEKRQGQPERSRPMTRRTAVRSEA